MLFVDVKKAHLNGKVPENEYVYVEAPEGTSSPGKCWKLRRWLYGMRPAAHAWEIDYSNHLKGFGMSKGLSAPTVFYCEEKQLRCVVHGDDFTALGPKEELDKFEASMATRSSSSTAPPALYCSYGDSAPQNGQTSSCFFGFHSAWAPQAGHACFSRAETSATPGYCARYAARAAREIRHDAPIFLPLSSPPSASLHVP